LRADDFFAVDFFAVDFCADDFCAADFRADFCAADFRVGDSCVADDFLADFLAGVVVAAARFAVPSVAAPPAAPAVLAAFFVPVSPVRFVVAARFPPLLFAATFVPAAAEDAGAEGAEPLDSLGFLAADFFAPDDGRPREPAGRAGAMASIGSPTSAPTSTRAAPSATSAPGATTGGGTTVPPSIAGADVEAPNPNIEATPDMAPRVARPPLGSERTPELPMTTLRSSSTSADNLATAVRARSSSSTDMIDDLATALSTSLRIRASRLRRFAAAAASSSSASSWT
jgi:hypothetical protein